MGTKTTPAAPVTTTATTDPATTTQVERTDAIGVADPATPATTEAPAVTTGVTEGQTVTISRTDFDALLEQAVAKGIEAGKASVQRTDPTDPPAEPAASTEAPAATETTITRADFEALNKRLDNMVIVRSDTGDDRVVARAAGEEVKRSDNEIFSGALNVTQLP